MLRPSVRCRRVFEMAAKNLLAGIEESWGEIEDKERFTRIVVDMLFETYDGTKIALRIRDDMDLNVGFAFFESMQGVPLHVDLAYKTVLAEWVQEEGIVLSMHEGDYCKDQTGKCFRIEKCFPETGQYFGVETSERDSTERIGNIPSRMLNAENLILLKTSAPLQD